MTQKPDLEAICEQALAASGRASSFIRSEVGKVAGRDIEEKETNSLVSYVDKTAEEMLVRDLSGILPQAGFITEEDTVLNESKAYTWIVDPLDGTTNFLQQIPIFSVSIALEYKGRLVLGIVEDIMHREQYYAWEGGGAWQDQNRIHVSKKEDFSQAIIATGFPYSHPDMLHDLVRLFQIILERSRGIRRLGSAAMDLTYVACGKMDGFYETTLNYWDIAAGIVLVREAGGTVTDFTGGQEFVRRKQVLASNHLLHSDLLAITSSVNVENLTVLKE